VNLLEALKPVTISAWWLLGIVAPEDAHSKHRGNGHIPAGDPGPGDIIVRQQFQALADGPDVHIELHLPVLELLAGRIAERPCRPYEDWNVVDLLILP